ncbi:hypothetical protein FAM19031_000588 [Propionibacterium freudenreichii]|uniref:hypothetical protein n=1 Tax=Propionibacterium freudenreichii TaxID=1744 RepID=UPI00243456BD|nr:hypothetical protein [Propionibacterium freudenreichii]MDK9294550.1 hypothetical protein [Propionibacterium freudenreichii]MDK9359879.1 hypothetical protein [Propionibacterium freudenreichii]MDK9657912.1 hypothetical protein [Propionibacterium freudenreichii]WFF31065.1 hypothetical protein FAM19024_000253 [Propionibacterium freudenreichii]
MSSPGPIGWARADLAAQLVAALPDMPVHPAMPGRINTPCAVIAERSPLAEPDQITGAITVHLEAVIFAHGLDPAAVAWLDTTTDHLIAELWDVLPAPAYGTVPLPDGQTYLVSRIPVDTTVTLTTD